MKTIEIKTIKLEANEDKMLTDGSIYGSVIFLGSNRSPDEFYEITKEEYEAVMAEKEKTAMLEGELPNE